MVSKFISNSFWLFVKAGLNYGLRFLYLVAVVKLLLPNEYGVISTINAWVLGVFSIGSFGLNMTLSRLVAVYDKENHDKLRNLVGFSIKYSLIISFAIAIIFIVISRLNIIPNITPIIPLIIIGVLLYFPYSFFGNIIFGLQRMRLLTIIDFLTNSSKIIFALLLIFLGFGYLGVVYGLYLSFFILLAIQIFILRRHIGFGKVDIKDILGHSISGYVTNIFYTIAVQGRIIIASFLFSQQNVGILALTLGIASYIGVIPGVINSAMFPLFSRNEQPKEILKRGLLIILLVSIPIIIFVSLFFKPLISIIAREEYVKASSYITLFFVAELVNSISIMFLSQIYALGHHIFTRNIYILMSPVTLILNIILMKWLNIFGAGLSYLIFTSVLLIISGFFLYKKKIL